VQKLPLLNDIALISFTFWNFNKTRQCSKIS
jgi:hypothetical protein